MRERRLIVVTTQQITHTGVWAPLDDVEAHKWFLALARLLANPDAILQLDVDLDRDDGAELVMQFPTRNIYSASIESRNEPCEQSGVP